MSVTRAITQDFTTLLYCHSLLVVSLLARDSKVRISTKTAMAQSMLELLWVEVLMEIALLALSQPA